MTTRRTYHTPADTLRISMLTLVILIAFPLLAASGLVLQLGFAAVAPLATLALAVVLFADWRRRTGEARSAVPVEKS